MLARMSFENRRGTGFLAATFDGFTALLLQRRVIAVEQCSKLTDHRDSYGIYQWGDISVRVFSLSRMFRPMAKTDRPYFILVRYAGGVFGMACDELQVIDPAQVNLKVIPTSLTAANSPIEAFAYLKKNIVFQCSLESIAALLPLDDAEPDAQGPDPQI